MIVMPAGNALTLSGTMPEKVRTEVQTKSLAEYDHLTKRQGVYITLPTIATYKSYKITEKNY